MPMEAGENDIEEEGAPVPLGKGGGGATNVSLVVPEAPAPPPPPVVRGRDTGSSIAKATRRPKPPLTTPTPTTPTTPTTATTATTARTPTTPTTSKTTTTPPPPLLCSVGTQTAISKLLPPDKLCDIVIYTHVRVFQRAVIGSVNDISYHAFRNACSTYVDTSCGLSFHVRYLGKDIFQTVEIRDDLVSLKEHSRMYHYGILNIIEDRTHVEKFATVTALGILKVMRKLLGSDRKRNKVFVGVGYYFYDDKNAWTDLAYTAENLGLPEVDILVILTTILTMPSPARCITLPVNVYRSQDLRPPTLASASASL
nr:BEACH domain-containing protein lvsF-like [Dermacentor andersoni]